MIRAILTGLLLLLATPAHAAFPTVAATNSTADSANATNHTVNLPTGISNGNLLLVTIACRNSTTTITFPAGWTIVGSEWTTGGSASAHSRMALYRRTADGSEGSTISVTTDVSNSCASISKRITGHHTSSNPELGTAATGDSTTPDPPSLTPSWGAEDTLWVAMSGKGAGGSASGYPTNYSQNQLSVPTTSGTNAALYWAERELNGTSDDPGTFTQSSAVWGAQTLAIRPAAAAVDGGGDAIWFP